MYTSTETKSEIKIKKPPRYAVFILNDDYTPWDFVVLTLMTVFNKDQNEASTITNAVHNSSQGCCGEYSKEIAETKVQISLDLAKQHKHPLRTIMREM